METGWIVELVSLGFNVVILLVTALISAKISGLKTFMFEKFVTQREFDISRQVTNREKS